jgi:hypothetical protein
MAARSSHSIVACLVCLSACVGLPPPPPAEESSSGPESTSTSTSTGTTPQPTTVDPDSSSSSADTTGSSSSGGATCGNGVIDEGEACDGRVLPLDADCTTLGFGEGMPRCIDDCTMLDYTVCPEYAECGNAEVNFGEECDGRNLGSMPSCGDFPNLMGDELACTDDCMYDTSACMACRENQQACEPSTDTCCDAKDVCSSVALKCCPRGSMGLCG